MDIKTRALKILVGIIMAIRFIVIGTCRFIWGSMLKWIVHVLMAVLMGPLYVMGLEDDMSGAVGVACLQVFLAALAGLILFIIAQLCGLIDKSIVNYLLVWAGTYTLAVIIEWICYIFTKAPEWQRRLNGEEEERNEDHSYMSDRDPYDEGYLIDPEHNDDDDHEPPRNNHLQDK